MAIQIEGKDAEGAVEFDDALEAAGNGKYQNKLIVAGAVTLFSSYMAITSVSFILPASQCDLNLDSRDKASLVSSGFIGYAISCHLWGFLSDTLGRNYVLWRCLLLDGILYIITSLTPNFPLILIWRFLNGVASCGVFVPLYAYIGEFHTSKNRTQALLKMSLLASSSYTFLPVFGWLIMSQKWSFVLYPGLLYKSWRLYYALLGLPSLTSSLIMYILPESPKFLVAKGEENEAIKILQNIHKQNTKENKENKFLVTRININEAEKSRKFDSENMNKVKAFFNLMWNQTIPLLKKPHRFNLMLICMTQCLLYLSNGGIYLWLPETLNRLANFKNDFPNSSATYCEVVQYKKEEIKFDNINNNNSNIFDNSVPGSNSYDILKNITSYNTPNNNNETNQPATCNDNIDFSVYVHLFLCGIFNPMGLLVIIVLTSFFDKKYVIGLFVLLSLGSSICMLVVDVLFLIPVSTTLLIVLSGSVIPAINSLAVDMFPTNLRSMAGCLTIMCCRFGTIITNVLAGNLIDTYCSVLIWTNIASFIVCFILVILTPKKLPYAMK